MLFRSDFVNSVKNVLGLDNIDNTLLNDVIALAPELMTGERPESIQGLKEEPLYHRASGEELNRIQTRTGINKLKTESKKTLFQSLVEFDVKHALRHFETWALSSDAYLHSKMREALDKSGLPWSQIKKTVQSMMTSQALHAENIANYFLQIGRAHV